MNHNTQLHQRRINLSRGSVEDITVIVAHTLENGDFGFARRGLADVGARDGDAESACLAFSSLVTRRFLGLVVSTSLLSALGARIFQLSSQAFWRAEDGGWDERRTAWRSCAPTRGVRTLLGQLFGSSS